MASSTSARRRSVSAGFILIVTALISTASPPEGAAAIGKPVVGSIAGAPAEKGILADAGMPGAPKPPVGADTGVAATVSWLGLIRILMPLFSGSRFLTSSLKL